MFRMPPVTFAFSILSHTIDSVLSMSLSLGSLNGKEDEGGGGRRKERREGRKVGTEVGG